MPTVPDTPYSRVALGGLPNLSFAGPGGGVTPDVRLSAPQLGQMQLTSPQFSLPSLSTPQFRAPEVRPGMIDPSSVRGYQISDRGAAQMQQTGANLEGAGDTLGQAAMAMQAKVNATVVDDALDQARQTAMHLTWGRKDEATGNVTWGYKNLKGEDAFRRPSEMGLDDEVGEQFQEAVKGIVDSKITNPLQRQAFDHQVQELGAQLRQGAAIHQAEQFDVYHDQVYKSAAANQTAEFTLVDPRDKNAQAAKLGELDQVVATRLLHQGADAGTIAVAQRQARSAAVASLFDRVVADKNYLQAQALLNDWGDKIDPDVATKMKLSIDGHVALQLGQQVGAEVYSHAAAPSFSAGDATRGFNIVVGMESNGRHVGDDGKVLKDSKGRGSFGVSQLQVSTAQDTAKKHPELVRLAGVKNADELVELAQQPTKAGEAANRLLGQTHYADLVTQFRGDPAKAMAAYNAGAGWLVGGKDRNGKPIKGALKEAAEKGGDWRDYLPAETKDYVAKGMQALGAGFGKPVRPGLTDLFDAVDKRVSDPEARKTAYEYVRQRYAADEQSEKDGKERAMAEGTRILVATGGNVNAISPELRASIDPKDWVTLQGTAKDLVEGKDRITDPGVYLTVMDPKVMRTLSPNQLTALQNSMSRDDYKRAEKLWQDSHTPEPSKSADSLDYTSVDNIVSNRLSYLGINASPSTQPKDKDLRARVAAIKQFAHQYVIDQQRLAGHKFETTADLEQVINHLFLKNDRFRNTVFGQPVMGERTINVITAKAGELDPTVREQLKRDLRKGSGGREPSDAEVLSAYWRKQFYK